MINCYTTLPSFLTLSSSLINVCDNVIKTYLKLQTNIILSSVDRNSYFSLAYIHLGQRIFLIRTSYKNYARRMKLYTIGRIRILYKVQKWRGLMLEIQMHRWYEYANWNFLPSLFRCFLGYRLEYRLSNWNIVFVSLLFTSTLLPFALFPCALKTIGIFKDCTFGRIEKITISSKKLPLAILFLWSSLFTQNSSLEEHMWARKSRTSVGTTKFFFTVIDIARTCCFQLYDTTLANFWTWRSSYSIKNDLHLDVIMDSWTSIILAA